MRLCYDIYRITFCGDSTSLMVGPHADLWLRNYGDLLDPNALQRSSLTFTPFLSSITIMYKTTTDIIVTCHTQKLCLNQSDGLCLGLWVQ